MSRSKLKKIFSISNEKGRKVIYLFGWKIKIRSKSAAMKHRIYCLEQENQAIRRAIRRLTGTLEGEGDLCSLKKIQEYFSVPTINRDEVNTAITMMRSNGLNTVPRERRIIISLTSYPGRMYDIHFCLYSLLTQSLKPDAVILWLAKEQFPAGEADIPPQVLALKKWGLSIQWCEVDMRSYKKLIPALQAYPEDFIVTADDDLYYAPDWLEVLWNNYLQTDKHSIVAHRCHKVRMADGVIGTYRSFIKRICDNSLSLFNLSTNGGGTLFPPHSLHPDVVDHAKAMKICPHADDIWFWGMAVCADTKIQVVDTPHPIRYTNAAREVNMNSDGTLYSVNLEKNNEQMSALCEAYPRIIEKLQEEADAHISVSVIIPIYNAASHLPACLDSLLAQTLERFEIICINDGSSDNSLEVLQRYAAGNSNIVIIDQQNTGSAGARNAGLKRARGEYIAFMDADDTVSENYLHSLYNTAITSQADIAATDQVFVCEMDGRRRKKKTGIAPEDRLLSTISEKGRIVIETGITWNKVYRTAYLRRHGVRFHEVNCTGQDNYFTALALIYANKVAICHDAVYNYIQVPTSSTHVGKTRKHFQILQFYKSVEQHILELDITDEQKRQWLQIVNGRKKKDYAAFYNDMLPEFKEEFKAIADAHINEIIL